MDDHGLPKLSIIVSRGCPYGCIFCDKSVFGRGYRSFSAKRIGEELESLERDFGAKDVAFLDSTFNISVQRVEGILNEIKKRKLKLTWTCSLRVNAITRDLLKRMKEALGLKTYEDVIIALLEEYRASRARELVDRLRLRDREAERLREVIKERRESWWRRSY